MECVAGMLKLHPVRCNVLKAHILNFNGANFISDQGILCGYEQNWWGFMNS